MTTYYPLTHAQRRVWYIEQIYPSTSVYNIGGLARIDGQVDLQMLEQAIHLFVQKNDGMRLQLTVRDGVPYQYVREHRPERLTVHDFSQEADPLQAARAWTQAEFRKSFPLEDQPLSEFALVVISENETAFLGKLHHLIADGWTISLCAEQISRFYEQLMRGEAVDVQPESSYLDYIEREQKYLTSARFEKNKVYWNEKFQVLPEHFLSKSSDELTGAREHFFLDATTTEAIRQFVEQQHISMNTLFVTLMLVYLARMSQQQDIIIGTPVMNRSGAKEKKMTGMFTSTMPFRMDVQGELTVSELLQQVGNELRENYFHQKYPYDLLVQDLQLSQKGYQNLFQWCVNSYNTTGGTNIDGKTLTLIEQYSGYQVYPLQLVVKDWDASGELELMFDYKTNDYSSAFVEGLMQRLRLLLEQILHEPTRTVQSLSLMTEIERHHLLDQWNATHAEVPETTITRLFEEQVVRTPERIAVSFRDEEWSYQRLNQAANRLARFLQSKGVGLGTRVGLLSAHGPETVVAILAVLKAGGVYVPIDAGHPAERIQYMLEDSQTPLLLTTTELPSGVSFAGDLMRVDDPALYDLYAELDDTNVEMIAQVDDPVYVIYTSGSTGNPKGTVITHGGLVNYIVWASKAYRVGADDAFALYSSLAFDLTVTSLFTPLLVGARMVIYAENGEEFVLHQILRDNQATIVKLTPAHLALIKDGDPFDSRVRALIVGGDELKSMLCKQVYDRFGGQVEIYNEYGPTETVVGCMLHRFDPLRDVGDAVPLGKPIDNMQIYLLDQHLQPVVPGAEGEMYISGHGMAKEYLHRPDLTAEKFIDNPFVPGQRMYRSGDLAVRSENGDVLYLGRRDNQVKIKGYRIELGEIENRLLRHENVQDAVVIGWTDERGNKHLVAYLVLKQEESTLPIRQFLVAQLPSYLIPTYLVPVDQIPLTPNGKVDRKALPDPTALEMSANEDVTEVSAEEAQLISILEDILQVTPISRHDNFFALGGDSIKAIQVVAKLGHAGLQTEVRDVLTYPTIKELAATLVKSDALLSEQQVVQGTIAQTPMSVRFFAQEREHAHVDHHSVLLDVKKELDPLMLQQAFQQLVTHHDSLRLSLSSDEPHPVLTYRPESVAADVSVRVYDLSDCSDAEQKERLEEIRVAGRQSIGMEDDFLFRVALIQLASTEQRLMITAHHLLVDSESWGILLDDLSLLLEGLEAGREAVLPAKTHSLQRWAEALERAVSEEKFLGELPYWKKAAEEPPVSCLVTATEAMHGTSQVETIELELSPSTTQSLLHDAHKRYLTQTNDLLLAGLALTVDAFEKRGTVALEVMGAGRTGLFDHVDVSRTIGSFTSLYPACFRVEGNELGEQLKSIKEQIRQIPHDGIGYGVLSLLTQDVAHDSSKRIRFHYMGDGTRCTERFVMSDLPYGTTSAADIESKRMTACVELVAGVVEDRLKLSLTFDQRQTSPEMAARFLEAYREQVETITLHCCAEDRVEFTPSDFSTISVSQESLDGLFD